MDELNKKFKEARNMYGVDSTEAIKAFELFQQAVYEETGMRI